MAVSITDVTLFPRQYVYTATVPLPTNYESDDLLFLMVVSDEEGIAKISGGTFPAGWTRDTSLEDAFNLAFWKWADGTETAPTFTWGSRNPDKEGFCAIMLSLSGVKATGTFLGDTFTEYYADNTNAGYTTTGKIVTTGPDSLVAHWPCIKGVDLSTGAYAITPSTWESQGIIGDTIPRESVGCFTDEIAASGTDTGVVTYTPNADGSGSLSWIGIEFLAEPTAGQQNPLFGRN